MEFLLGVEYGFGGFDSNFKVSFLSLERYDQCVVVMFCCSFNFWISDLHSWIESDNCVTALLAAAAGLFNS